MECTASICVPDLCDPVHNIPFCETFINQPVSLNQLYSAAYMLYKGIPDVTSGIPQMIQSDLSWWLIKLTITQFIPYLITFTMLFFVMIANQLISPSTGILLLVSLIILIIICLAWFGLNTEDVVTGLYDSIVNKVNENWAIYGPQIECNAFRAFINPKCVRCENPICNNVEDEFEYYEE